MKPESLNIIQLGDNVRDTITGFKGRVVGITDWLYQCRRLGLQASNLDKDGQPLSLQWFDELQCETIEANGGKSKDMDAKGGPMPIATRNKEPKK